MATAAARVAEARTLEELYPRLNALSIQAGWAKPTPSLWPLPRENFEPRQWSWAEGRIALDAAGRLVSTELAERRNLILYNPVDPARYATVRTLICAYQMILAREVARSHRHTPNALRLVLEGEGATTVVDGERLFMKPNDVILTPAWCWHGHEGAADAPCYWLDCLDAPLVHLLEPMFLESHPQIYEPVTSVPTDSPYIFRWATVQDSLARTAPDPSGRHGRRVALESPALKNIGLYMEHLDRGARTKPYRTTANNVFCCVEGEGVTTVGETRFVWRRGDVVAIPAWRMFAHEAKSDATLFTMTDEPVHEVLGWLRTADA